jgi:hypothetical protein
MTSKNSPSAPIALEQRGASGARLHSPSAGRNKQIIADTLKPLLTQDGHVLEIASGTGEHGFEACRARPDIAWQYSDPDATSRASQDDWRQDNPIQLRPALPLDMTAVDWWGGLPNYTDVYSANMVHIAPIEACYGLAMGAAHLLKDGGRVFLYGPFLDGDNSAPSNLDFDKSLKSRNPKWGVREQGFVKHIFAKAGFNDSDLIAMPKNNHIFIFSRG